METTSPGDTSTSNTLRSLFFVMIWDTSEVTMPYRYDWFGM